MAILIAEDDHISSQLLRRLLLPFGDVDVAEDGAEAIEAFTFAHGEGQPYHLICLDIMMPKKDGLTVLQELRQYEDDHQLAPEQRAKIVMTTALGDKEHVVEAARHRCDGYLLKPYYYNQIIGKLRQIGLEV